MNLLLLFVMVHFLVDFLFQRSEIAETKSYKVSSMLLHIVEYTSMSMLLSICIGFVLGIVTVPMVTSVVGFWIFNGLIHWAIDYNTSQISHRYYKQGDTRSFIQVIGLDQALHTMLLVATYFDMFAK